MDHLSIPHLPGAGHEPTTERDLEAALQLLAERARYLTGASGASIGLRAGTGTFCRAAAGPSALEVGTRFPAETGIMGESLQLRQILRCRDTKEELSVGEQDWSELGIRSMMVAPLVRDGEAVGVFELVAERTHAFEDRDVATLQRLSEMILTAIEQFDLASQPETEASDAETQEDFANHGTEPDAEATTELVLKKDQQEPELPELSKVQRCQACGFPVSESRTLCLDCQEAQGDEQRSALLGQLSSVREPGWLQSHLYTVGTLFIAALTVAMLVLKFR
jgi:GAF domain-containing protein